MPQRIQVNPARAAEYRALAAVALIAEYDRLVALEVS